MSHSGRVLVVDDDPRGIAALEGLLGPEGYEVITAASGPEALHKARAKHPDLMLLDVMMPDMDGFDVCRIVRADPDLAELPIILVTALDDRDALLQGLDAGADELVTKPFHRLELRTRVRTLTRINRYRRAVEERQARERMQQGLIELLLELLALAKPRAFSAAHRARDRVRELAVIAGLPVDATLELTTLLSQIGALTLPGALIEKEAAGRPLSDKEFALIAQVPAISRRLLDHLPDMAAVAGLLGEVAAERDDVSPTAHLVRQALTEVRTSTPAPLIEGIDEPDVAMEDSVREVTVAELELGWRLSRDLLARDGTLLLVAGNEITPTVLECIRNFDAVVGLRRPILVEMPREEEPEDEDAPIEALANDSKKEVA